MNQRKHTPLYVRDTKQNQKSPMEITNVYLFLFRQMHANSLENLVNMYRESPSTVLSCLLLKLFDLFDNFLVFAKVFISVETFCKILTQRKIKQFIINCKT